MARPETQNVTIPFGKHKGTLVTRLPLSYLRWLANEVKMDEEWKTLAKAELERRGTALPTLELSGHAIDRASLRCRKTWHETRGEEEGLYSWLMRVAGEALATPQTGEDGTGAVKHRHLGIQFVFQQGEEFPVLKTVMPVS